MVRDARAWRLFASRGKGRNRAGMMQMVKFLIEYNVSKFATADDKEGKVRRDVLLRERLKS